MASGSLAFGGTKGSFCHSLVWYGNSEPLFFMLAILLGNTCLETSHEGSRSFQEEEKDRVRRTEAIPMMAKDAR
jgi:hypothetical protein